jgi:hypothetical protein
MALVLIGQVILQKKWPNILYMMLATNGICNDVTFFGERKNGAARKSTSPGWSWGSFPLMCNLAIIVYGIGDIV